MYSVRVVNNTFSRQFDGIDPTDREIFTTKNCQIVENFLKMSQNRSDILILKNV